jgi:hypothetical protein
LFDVFLVPKCLKVEFKEAVKEMLKPVYL